MLDLGKAVSFEGRTGPYLLYSVVRIRHILEKASETGGSLRLATPRDRELAIACLGLGAAVSRAVDGRAPDELVSWAFGLATAFARFYASCPVASETDGPLRLSRITLCIATERALSESLRLLGCVIPDAM